VHLKNRCREVSECLEQQLHMEGKEQPLIERLSSVGSLLCSSLQTFIDLEGGTSGDQITLA